MIAALLLSAMCAARLDAPVREVKGMPAYAGVRNATIEPMRTDDFLGEMGLYYGSGAQRILAFADPPVFRAFVREDYLCSATANELLQTVMHEFAHLAKPGWTEKQVDDFVYQNWPRRIGPPTADPIPRMLNWRNRNGRP